MSVASPATNGIIAFPIDENAVPTKKPGRKRKEPSINSEDSTAKAKDVRKPVVKKPRAAKDPNAPPAPRKRKSAGDSLLATETAAASSNMSAPNAPGVGNVQPASLPKQYKITDLVNPVPSHQSASTSQIAKDPPTPTQRPASSGRMFDPIRGATVDKPPVSPTPASNMLSRASASPAIKSLMNPAAAMEPIRMAAIPTTTVPSQPGGTVASSTVAPAATMVVSSKSSAVPTKSRPKEDIPKPKKVEAASATTSNAPTPPQKPKISREIPPLPTGSGLLSGTPFGLTAAPGGTSTLPGGTNIWLKFDLRGKENVTINFAHEVEKKYGAAALNPRLAARKERQRQLALAGAALERELGESAEDMSIDMSEPESNNDTDGPTKDGTDGEPAKKKRKRRTEDYDRNDDFIDDEEVLLEEQALMTKDGFFVYSGPLIQEGERPAVERADGSIRRPRGTKGAKAAGRGTNGETGRAAPAAAKKSGGAARAGGAPRKPRVTKAEKAAMDAEKLAREKLAASMAVRSVPAVVT